MVASDNVINRIEHLVEYLSYRVFGQAIYRHVTYILRIYKPLISSTNHRLIYTYTRRILIKEKQRVNPFTPSTGLKRRVSILPVYIWYTLTIYIARPNPTR